MALMNVEAFRGSRHSRDLTYPVAATASYQVGWILEERPRSSGADHRDTGPPRITAQLPVRRSAAALMRRDPSLAVRGRRPAPREETRWLRPRLQRSLPSSRRSASRRRRPADDGGAARRQPAGVGRGGQPGAGRRSHGPAAAAEERSRTSRRSTICTASARSASSGRWRNRRAACGCSSRASRARAPSSCRATSAAS